VLRSRIGHDDGPTTTARDIGPQADPSAATLEPSNRTASTGARRRGSARLRILGLYVVVVMGALALTVTLLRGVLLGDLRTRIDGQLVQEADELARFVSDTPPDPAETPATYVDRVLTAYLSGNVPSRDEAFLAVVGGVPRLASAGAPIPVETIDGVLLDAQGAAPQFRSASTSAGDVRVLTVPLRFDNRTEGAFVVVAFEADERAVVDRTIRDAMVVALVALVAATAIAWIIAGRVLRPIGLLARTALQISDTDLSRRLPVQGSDEIAELITTFNTMLDRLEGSFARQRRFLDDAGHELRTPITIVRGHLELAGNDPSAFAATRTTVLGELDRMARIVDDLLVLAKAEQPDFVARTPVDVDELLSTMLQSVRPLAQRAWTVEAAPPVIAHVDRHRVQQAMLNLAANAARHSTSGSTVALGGSVDGTTLRLWVRDEGEGIDPSDHTRVFQRFARARTSRGPSGSAGLGLAIVQAIVEAHGGSIELRSALGAGATFTLVFPNAVEAP
jgi:two-component system, OmpR family, sensor kinase